MSDTAKRAYVHQVNVSRGGVPKLPVMEALVSEGGVEGDMQRDKHFHGGPTRAVCLYSLELIEALRAEGHMISPGSVGENLTITGLDWPQLRIGDTLSIGDTLRVEITSHASPCSNIKESFVEGQFTRISHKLHPGTSRLYARVLTPGLVRSGDPVTRDS
jgi:MOSC domain-containing protein YiiM